MNHILHFTVHDFHGSVQVLYCIIFCFPFHFSHSHFCSSPLYRYSIYYVCSLPLDIYVYLKKISTYPRPYAPNVLKINVLFSQSIDLNFFLLFLHSKQFVEDLFMLLDVSLRHRS